MKSLLLSIGLYLNIYKHKYKYVVIQFIIIVIQCVDINLPPKYTLRRWNVHVLKPRV